MSTMSEYFTLACPAWEAHPMIRYWQSLKNNQDVVELRMELYRPREGLTFRPADIYVHIKRRDGGLTKPERADWEDILNEGLLRMGVQATTRENEAQRVSLMLQSSLAPIDARVGDAFFNSVLIETLREAPFASCRFVPATLARLKSDSMGYEPSWNPNAWSDCARMIKNAIAGRAKELVSDLGYAQPEAEEILDGALAQYLDERFNITNLEMLSGTSRPS